MIPKSVLEGLKCTLCQNGLSIFPVHSYGARDVYICGRCPLKEDFLPQPEHLYEELAQYIEFPCRYQANGCIERLKPNDLKNHEISCPHKPCLCPILPLGECKWQGDYRDLLEHYSDCHPMLTLKNSVTEVDTVNSYEKNCVFYQADETFIAQFKHDESNKMFYCNVLCSNIESKTKKYCFRISFTNNRITVPGEELDVQVGDLTFTANENTAVVNINQILSKLSNPGCVICKIDIITIAHTAAVEQNFGFVDDDNEMLQTLECPVCLEYMVPPIMQCHTGHSFCESHKAKLQACPTCNGSVGETRNYILEQITNIIPYPCKYSRYGCSYSTNAKDIRDHEATCTHGPYKCIFDSCPWEDKFSKLKGHLLENHMENILDISTVNYILDEDTPTESNTYIFACYDHIFKLLFNREGDTFVWSLQVIGQNDDYRNYMLELDFDSAMKEKIYIRKQCCPQVPTCALNDDVIVRLSKMNLTKFFNEDILTYKVRVIDMK